MPVFCVTGPYGQVVYGQPWSLPSGPGFGEPDPRKYSGTLGADATRYGTIDLFWTLPSGTPINRFAIVRAAYGAPTSRYTGVTVIESDPASPVRSTSDSGLFPGRWYYYSLFVRDSTSEQWIRAATAQQIAVNDWGYHQSMMDSLPAIYKTMDRSMVGSVEEGPLYRLLKIFAFEYDWLRTLGGSAEQSRSIPDVGAQMLPSISADLGTPYETVLGDTKMRGILASIIEWRKDKGHGATLDDLVQTIASCADAHYELVPNRLLDHNDSGWDEPTLGRWVPEANAIITRGTDTPPPRSSAGYLQVEADTAADTSVATSTAAGIFLNGIKVKPGGIYCGSVYTRSDGVDRSVSVDIEWYDIDGVLAASDAPENTESWGPFGEVVWGTVNPHGPRGPLGSGPSGTPNVVSQITAVNNDTDWETRVHIAKVAPADAQFARMVITIEDTLAGELHYIDEAQFEEATEPSPFEPARKVIVYACGARTNKALNPSFEVNGLAWSVLNSALTITATEAKYGTKSLLLEPLAPGVTAASTMLAIDPGKFYTFSSYIKALDADCDVLMAMEWLDEDDNVLRTFGREDNVISDGTWKRSFVTDVGPAGAVRAQCSVICYPLTADRVAIDGVLVESGNVVQDYFDGSFAGVDYSWTGVAHASPSIYIVDRDIYEDVLGRYLDEYIPASTPWEIVYTA
jgi:hypothetical protein